MKKGKRIFWLVCIAVLAILFVPIPKGSYDDGGTREFVALTYKIVRWHRLYDDGVDKAAIYEKTRFYGPADRNTPIGELWEREMKHYGRRNVEYTEEWLDKSTAEKYDTAIFGDIVITEIYKNCFFAQTVIPMPYTIKLNGTLSADWCVGDQVICTYENTYYDAENHRVEADFLTVEISDWEPDPTVAYKPVIYLYPEEETEVSVTVEPNGGLTCTYPAYGDGWNVTAAPDGTLTDAQGQTYGSLFWEGVLFTEYGFTEGFCVPGADTAAFLEDALARLGLSRREANEFIVYWLPLMQENPYNVIAFQTEAYTDAAPLTVVPAPDTVIRVFMTWKAADSFTELVPQTLTAPAREGFTVVEWGGTEEK